VLATMFVMWLWKLLIGVPRRGRWASKAQRPPVANQQTTAIQSGGKMRARKCPLDAVSCGYSLGLHIIDTSTSDGAVDCMHYRPHGHFVVV